MYRCCSWTLNVCHYVLVVQYFGYTMTASEKQEPLKNLLSLNCKKLP